MVEIGKVPAVVLAGAGGDLGGRIVGALRAKGVSVRALVRRHTHASARPRVHEIVVDYNDRDALQKVCADAVCVVSALNGIAPAILDAQGRLLDAAVAVGVPRFIPSDFCLDYLGTEPGGNRNMDLRRDFMGRIDATAIRATFILNGPFADLLSGQAPIVLHKLRRVLYWGDAGSARSTSRPRTTSPPLPRMRRSILRRHGSCGSPVIRSARAG